MLYLLRKTFSGEVYTKRAHTHTHTHTHPHTRTHRTPRLCNLFMKRAPLHALCTFLPPKMRSEGPKWPELALIGHTCQVSSSKAPFCVYAAPTALMFPGVVLGSRYPSRVSWVPGYRSSSSMMSRMLARGSTSAESDALAAS